MDIYVKQIFLRIHEETFVMKQKKEFRQSAGYGFFSFIGNLIVIMRLTADQMAVRFSQLLEEYDSWDDTDPIRIC